MLGNCRVGWARRWSATCRSFDSFGVVFGAPDVSRMLEWMMASRVTPGGAGNLMAEPVAGTDHPSRRSVAQSLVVSG